jgi:cysteine desulfurase
MAAAFQNFDANPHSTHAAGMAARQAVEEARQLVASLIEAEPAEIIFLSGATEANNLAFHGVAPLLLARVRTRLLISAGEHPSVIAAAAAMPGFTVEAVPLLASGTIDLDALTAMIGPDVGLVSVSAANHEVGTIQPIPAIARLVHDAGALMHSDMAQAIGKTIIAAHDVDLGSLSSHKMGGPVGIGALYVRRRLRRHLAPLLHGGGQEGGARAGTVPTPLCVAFGESCRLATTDLLANMARVSAMRDDLLSLLAAPGGLVVNGAMTDRLPGNLNVTFAGVDGEALVMRVRATVAISTGSACTSTSLEPSHVLTAIGLDERSAAGAVRMSLGPSTTEAEIKTAAAIINAAVASLRTTYRKVA